MTKEQEDKDEEEGRADQSDEVNSSDWRWTWIMQMGNLFLLV
jgi:uncharacterized protein YmfQ (DUF2313 family)